MRPSPRCAARSLRCRRRSAPSRSAASGPTSWPARARPSNWRLAASASTGSTCWPSDTMTGFVDVDVEVDCSSGTYIRALARDVGAALGVGGHLTALRRTRVGRFGLDQARTLDDLAERPRLSYILDEACLQSFPRRDLSDSGGRGHPARTAVETRWHRRRVRRDGSRRSGHRAVERRAETHQTRRGAAPATSSEPTYERDQPTLISLG